MPATESTSLLWPDFDRRDRRGGGSGGFYRSLSQDRPQLPYWRQDEVVAPTKHKDLSGNNPHAQFCTLIGCPPSGTAKDHKFVVDKKSLYGRATSLLASQRLAYNFSASLSNSLLLSQVVLGAALTALGASASSHILITIFGAMNTIIAGLVAYLKSRGQPMRARMYRDDLERLVDEIENSEVMWRGISEGVHGYEEIDTDEVTVRSEVARLTRLYERAVRLNGVNNPDLYLAGAGGFDGNQNGGVRPSRGGPYPGLQGTTLPGIAVPAAPQPSTDVAGPSAVPITAAAPEDASPATKVVLKDEKKEEKKPAAVEAAPAPKVDAGSAAETPAPSSSGQADSIGTPAPAVSPAAPAESASAPPAPAAPAPAPTSVQDPDASPATAAILKPKRTKSNADKVEGLSNGVKAS